MPPQVLLLHCPPQFDIGPQLEPQELIHALVHTLEQAELPHPWLHVTKQLPEQLIKHQLEQPLVHDELAHDVAQLSLQVEPHELEEIKKIRGPFGPSYIKLQNE